MKKENPQRKISVNKKKKNLEKENNKTAKLQKTKIQDNAINKKTPKVKTTKAIETPKIEVQETKIVKEEVKSEIKNYKTYYSPVAVWDFRASANEITYAQLKDFLTENTKRWIFQKEKGEEKGYIHFQGRFSLIKRKRKNELIKIFKDFDFPIPNYIEPSSSNSLGQWFYVMKNETRIEGPWKDTDEEIYVPKHIKNAMDNPYPFQQQIINSTKTNREREVNVIYDPTGCSGKTTVATWLCVMSDAILVPMCYKTNDIIQYICSICMQKKLRSPSPIFIDLPRATPKTALQEVYAAIEILKSGLLYDTRFTGKRWVIESPAIWVFTNVEPDSTWLSKDRWKLWTIDDKKNLSTYSTSKK